jgi:flagellar biosynthesis GTPase FlhF
MSKWLLLWLQSRRRVTCEVIANSSTTTSKRPHQQFVTQHFNVVLREYFPSFQFLVKLNNRKIIHYRVAPWRCYLPRSEQCFHLPHSPQAGQNTKVGKIDTQAARKNNQRKSFFPAAPAGHTYYYHAATKQSTYTRPLPPIHMGGPPPPFPPNMNQLAPSIPPSAIPHDATYDSTTEKKSKKSKKEKPLKKTPIPDTEWIRVVTTLGNVFFTHTGRKESVWTCPEEIAEAVAELEKEEEREKAEQEAKEKEEWERAEVERVKKEVEAAGAKRKAEETSDTASKKPRVKDEEEEDEAWQRELAEELAREEKEKTSSKGKDAEVSIPPVFSVPDQVKLNPEEAKALFTVSRLFI